MEKANILVVDDMKGTRLTLSGILEDEGHTVVTAESGYEAIEATRNSNFNTVFMDIKMPGMNGVQALREIKKTSPGTAVIMMTGFSVDDLIKEALIEGAYEIISKPLDIEQITRIIEDVLQKLLILVVDDQQSDRETLKAILEERDYRVSTAADGYETIEMIKNRKYNLIFMDIKLPGINGVETFQQVKQIAPGTTVIMMTGFSQNDLVKKAIDSGAQSCIYKPFDMEKVLALVEDNVRRR